MASHLDFDGEFGPQEAARIRDALRSGGMPRLLAWLYTKDFRTDESTLDRRVGGSPSETAMTRDGQATGAKKVLDFFASVIGEEVKLPIPPFRKVERT